jgi:hypothetical protein
LHEVERNKINSLGAGTDVAAVVTERERGVWEPKKLEAGVDWKGRVLETLLFEALIPVLCGWRMPEPKTLAACSGIVGVPGGELSRSKRSRWIWDGAGKADFDGVCAVCLIEGGIKLSGNRSGNGFPASFSVIRCIATAKVS